MKNSLNYDNHIPWKYLDIQLIFFSIHSDKAPNDDNTQESHLSNWTDEINHDIETDAGPSSSANNSNDIRISNPTDEQEKIIHWCNKLDATDRTATNIV